jgi:hypothetical protein
MKAEIYKSATLYSAESILFNSWSPGVMRGHNRVNISTPASMGKIFENILKKPLSQKKSSNSCLNRQEQELMLCYVVFF